MPAALPSLIKAYRIQDKARNVGFDWEEREQVWDKVKEEIGEFQEEVANMDKEKAEAEFGDVMFSLINAARLYKINPDNALELTIKELSEILHTNRTYLSAYIKTTYKMTFREWITSLRLEYAKNMLKEHPEINIQKLAESSGFLSRSNFIKLFSEKEGCTPAKWKKANLE